MHDIFHQREHASIYYSSLFILSRRCQKRHMPYPAFHFLMHGQSICTYYYICAYAYVYVLYLINCLYNTLENTNINMINNFMAHYYYSCIRVGAAWYHMFRCLCVAILLLYLFNICIYKYIIVWLESRMPSQKWCIYMLYYIVCYHMTSTRYTASHTDTHDHIWMAWGSMRNEKKKIETQRRLAKGTQTTQNHLNWFENSSDISVFSVLCALASNQYYLGCARMKLRFSRAIFVTYSISFTCAGCDRNGYFDGIFETIWLWNQFICRFFFSFNFCFDQIVIDFATEFC